MIYDSYRLIFFEIDFAKALFGENLENHLNNLAVSTDIFSYLEDKILQTLIIWKRLKITR